MLFLLPLVRHIKNIGGCSHLCGLSNDSFMSVSVDFIKKSVVLCQK